jgi:dolichol-phosphate mannosyltransferase
MRVLTVIPTYNEIDNLEPLVVQVLRVVPSSVEVLIVDDGSPDGTGVLADSLATQYPHVHVLHRPKKMGLGSAYVKGFSWGLSQGFEAFIEMDADFSHNPRYMPQMLENLRTYDFVMGSRNILGGGTVNWGLSRKLLSRAGSLYARLILGAPIQDFTGGFNGWRKEVLEAVSLPTLKSDGYSFQIELKYRAFLRKFSWIEFPIIFEDRKVGYSKMNRKIIWEALRRVWEFRFKAHAFLSSPNS